MTDELIGSARRRVRAFLHPLAAVPGVAGVRRWLSRRRRDPETVRALGAERDLRRAVEGEIEVLRTRLDEALGEVGLRRRADTWAVPELQRPDGVNVVGYVQHQLGLGEDARRLIGVLAAGSVPTSVVNHGLTDSPVLPSPVVAHQRLDHTTSIAVMAADQVMLLSRIHPELRQRSKRLIGYCMWELETLSDQMRRGARSVDEIWVRSEFAGRAFSELGTPPVHVVPLPVPEPRPAPLGRGDFEALADHTDRLVFGVVFDHFSVMARKNPIGAIDAFRRAFSPGEGPLLLVKTLNAERFPDDHRRLLEHAADRPDIVVWDAHLTRDRHHALMATFDVLVGLHRSEGYGLHLAEAMWLGTPVIATRYSGNLDFMDDDNSMLVDHTMVEVMAGGGIYPDGARWAEPDLDHAAALMRRLADDGVRRKIGHAASRTMSSQPTDDDVAVMVRRRLGLDVSATRDGSHDRPADR